MQELPEKGSPLAFTIEVGVRPKAKLGDYKGLEVGRREPDVPGDAVDQEARPPARVRSRRSRPSTARHRRATSWCSTSLGKVDGEPFEGGEARGYLLELGSDRLVEGFEEQLEGATAGDDRTVDVTFPDDYRAEHLAGREATFDDHRQGGQGEAAAGARR